MRHTARSRTVYETVRRTGYERMCPIMKNGRLLRWSLCFLFMLLCIASAHAEVALDEAHFPDADFREYLSGYDRDGNGVLGDEELRSVTYIMMLSGQHPQLASLQGVEYLTELKSLILSSKRDLVSVDLSRNTKLEELQLDLCGLTELDVSQNTALRTLNCEAKREPAWMRELPKPGNDTYIYVRESGEGTTVEIALAQAMVRVFQSTANRLGQPFDAQKVNNDLINGSDYKTISKQQSIPVNRVGVYSTQLSNGKWWVYVLCQVAAMSNVEPVWERLGLTSTSEALVSLAKSTILPGWGQISKGYTKEGLLTMGGEVLLVGGGILSYRIAQNQLNIMRTPNVSVSDFAAASKQYQTMQTLSYVSWGMAGALYVFNIIRAISAHPKSSYDITFAPSAITTPYSFSPTIGLTYRF